MEFEDIDVGIVFAEKDCEGCFYVIHKTDNYIVVLQYSSIHLVSVPMIFSNEYDFSNWYVAEYSDYLIEDIFNRLVTRKKDEWTDTLYKK